MTLKAGRFFAKETGKRRPCARIKLFTLKYKSKNEGFPGLDQQLYIKNSTHSGYETLGTCGVSSSKGPLVPHWK